MIEQFFEHYEIVMMGRPGLESYIFNKNSTLDDLKVPELVDWLSLHHSSISIVTISDQPRSSPFYRLKITFPSRDIQMLFKLRWAV